MVNRTMRALGLAAAMMYQGLSNPDNPYTIPKHIPNGNGMTGKVLGAGKAPELHEYTIQGHTVMAENRTKAIKKLIKQGKIKDKKKK